MSAPQARHSHGEAKEPVDPVEALAAHVPIVLPVVGGVLMFLLAFIAIYMA